MKGVKLRRSFKVPKRFSAQGVHVSRARTVLNVFVGMFQLTHSRKCRSFLPYKQHYSPGWALASSTICLQASRFLALSLHLLTPIFLRSVDTASSHLILGLPLRLVAYRFPYNVFFGIALSCILSKCQSHRILWHLINLTIFSTLIMVSNSSFRRTRHNSLSFTGPYIFRKIFLSNIANVLSSSTVSVHDSEP